MSESDTNLTATELQILGKKQLSLNLRLIKSLSPTAFEFIRWAVNENIILRSEIVSTFLMDLSNTEIPPSGSPEPAAESAADTEKQEGLPLI